MKDIAAWFMGILAIAAVFVIVSHGEGTGKVLSSALGGATGLLEAATGQAHGGVVHEGAGA